MGMQRRLILELMLRGFELGHNVMEASKSICCAEDEGVVDHSSVTRRNFARVTRDPMISQGQVDLQTLIQKLCVQPLNSNQAMVQ